MNRLFVAYKPPFIPSNTFLNRIKRRYGQKKAGFSGTLDPFACGSLIIAFGIYTKLFRFLKKYPKTYRATLWLGAKSPSLDIERIEEIHPTASLPLTQIERILHSFKGDFTYIPPIFSAKKINGKRAYKAAAKGEHIALTPVTSTIYDIRLLAYRHPFLSFEATVSEGTYIRSLGEHIAKAFGYEGALSYLERMREGLFSYQEEKALDPLAYLATTPNSTTRPPHHIWHGKKLFVQDLQNQTPGQYHLVFKDFFAIVSVQENKSVRYLLNQIPRYKQ